MSEAMQRRLVMLFCLQAGGDLETYDDQTMCFALRITASELEKTRRLFINKGFILGQSWVPRNWDKRQRASDDVNERVKRHRENKRNVTHEANGNVTRNVGETSQTRLEQKQNRQEGDTETDDNPLTPSGENGEVLSSEEKPDEYPEYPEPDGMFIIMPGHREVDESGAREIWGAIWRTWKNARLCYQFYEHQLWYSKAAWLYSIKKAIEQQTIPGSLRFLETIACSYDTHGPKKEKGRVVPGQLDRVQPPKEEPKTYGIIQGP